MEAMTPAASRYAFCYKAGKDHIETLMLVKTEGRSRRGGQKMRWVDGITNSMDVPKPR